MSARASRRVAAGLLCAAGVLLAAGCSGKPPVLSRVYGRVIYVRDAAQETGAETLGIFLVASDPDGMENLSAFYVINDEAELFWKVDSTAWTSSTAEGENWIGTTSLSMPGSATIPAGDYRVVLESSGGATVEAALSIPARTVTAAQAKYPSASVQNGVIKVAGSFPGYEVWVYGPDGRFAGTFASANGPVTIQSLQAAAPALANGFTFRVFSWNAKAGYGVLSAPSTAGSLPPG